MTFEQALAETLRSIDKILADRQPPNSLPEGHLERVGAVLKQNLQARQIEFNQPHPSQIGLDTFYECWLPAPDLEYLVHGCGCEYRRRHEMFYAYVPRDRSARVDKSRNGRINVNIVLNDSLNLSSVALVFYPRPQLPKREGYDLYDGVYLNPHKAGYVWPINQSEHGLLIAEIGEDNFTFYQACRPVDGSPARKYHDVPFSGKLYIADRTRIHYLKLRKVMTTTILDLLDQGILTAFFKHIGYEQLDALVHASK